MLRIIALRIKESTKHKHHPQHPHHPNKVTSITFSKQKKALFNQKIVSGKIVERSTNDDRIKCRDNFTEYINKKKENNETIKGKRCSIYDFVKDAIK